MLNQVLLTIFLIILFFSLTLFVVFCNHTEQWLSDSEISEYQEDREDDLSVASTATYDSVSISIDVPQDPVI